jgi:hypothetical protein
MGAMRGSVLPRPAVHFRTATERFLHCRPTFCLVTEMGKHRFQENYLSPRSDALFKPYSRHTNDFLGQTVVDLNWKPWKEPSNAVTPSNPPITNCVFYLRSRRKKKKVLPTRRTKPRRLASPPPASSETASPNPTPRFINAHTRGEIRRRKGSLSLPAESQGRLRAPLAVTRIQKRGDHHLRTWSFRSPACKGELGYPFVRTWIFTGEAMAALCQRVSWHHVSSQFVTVRRDGTRSSQRWSGSANSGERSLPCARASTERGSPFTEKASVKRVRGGGHPSGVALKSLELWSAEPAAARAREVSNDGLQSLASTTAELREPNGESPGECQSFPLLLGFGAVINF